jgi:hypothetical protein
VGWWIGSTETDNTLEDGDGVGFRNVGKSLHLHAAVCPKKCRILSLPKLQDLHFVIYQNLLTTEKGHRLNLLNAELNLICHLLILLGDLTFMGTCIVGIFQYISNTMQRYTFYLYLETTLHISGGTSTHHQERIQLYRFECAVGGVRHPPHTQTLSISSTIAADSSNGVTNTRCCRYSCMRSWWWVEVPPETCSALSRYK